MLILTLTKKWFEKYVRGEKHTDYRVVKPYWTKRLFDINGKPKKECILQLGYSDKNRLHADIVKIELLQSGAEIDLHCIEPVYAIHMANIKYMNS